jgi:crotonobetainyl-CoA:carnitine CoA-transferase CaiB-like acyl-CoA transferase
MTRDEVVAKLERSGLPFAPIARPEDLFDDPHLAGSGGLEPVTLPDGTETRLPTLPVAFGPDRPGRPAVLPQPGADQHRLS